MLGKLSLQAEFVFSTDRQPVKQVQSVVSIFNVCRDLAKASAEGKGETWDASYKHFGTLNWMIFTSP